MADGAVYGGMTGGNQRYGMGGTAIPPVADPFQNAQMNRSPTYQGQMMPPNDPSLSRNIQGRPMNAGQAGGINSAYGGGGMTSMGPGVNHQGYGNAAGFGGARAINGFGAIGARNSAPVSTFGHTMDTGVRPGVAAPVQGPPPATLEQIQAEMARRQVGSQLGPRNAALSGYMMGR